MLVFVVSLALTLRDVGRLRAARANEESMRLR
jgi:hypothetical protein